MAGSEPLSPSWLALCRSPRRVLPCAVSPTSCDPCPQSEHALSKPSVWLLSCTSVGPGQLSSEPLVVSCPLLLCAPQVATWEVHPRPLVRDLYSFSGLNIDSCHAATWRSSVDQAAWFGCLISNLTLQGLQLLCRVGLLVTQVYRFASIVRKAHLGCSGAQTTFSRSD